MSTQAKFIGNDQGHSLTERRAYLQLPLDVRRKQLAAQADRMVKHYEQESERNKREGWQGGDLVESE